MSTSPSHARPALAPPPADADTELLARAAEFRDAPAFHELNVEMLAALSAQHGLEFATAVLYDRASRAPGAAPFRHGFGAGDVPPAPAPPDVIGIVPGAFHGQHKHTGADGLRIADTVHGLAPRIEVIPVRSFGSLDENAATVLQWLAARRGQRIVLASLSKGGADLKRALARTDAHALWADVSLWVNISGIVFGTPLVAWLRARPLRLGALSLLLRLQGHRAAAIPELRRDSSGPLAGWPTTPKHLRLVHLCGCPLRRHLSHKWAPRGYERLAPLGPNDGGGILLGDLAKLPGIVVPIWGADHYLQPAWDARPLLRSLIITAMAAGERAHAAQSATAPSTPPASRSIA